MSSAGRFEHFDAKVAEAMQKMPGGGLPDWLGIRFVEFTAGHLVAEMSVRDELLTPFKNLHGGVMAALVDHVLGCVLYPLMQRGAWAATTEFKLNYLAPVKAGTLRAASQVVALTRTTAVVRVEVENDGRAVCVAQGTLLVQQPKPKDAGA